MRSVRLLTIGALSAALLLPAAVSAGGTFTATLTLKAYTRVRTVPLTAGKTNVPDGKTVNAWFVSETGSPAPLAGTAGWKNVPTDFKLGDADGAHTVYIWARATGGVISARGSDATFLDRVLPEVGDVTTVPAQDVTPPTISTRNVSVTFDYSDPGENDVPATGSGVVKYAVVNGVTAPISSSTDWKLAPDATGPVTVPAHKVSAGNGVKNVSVFVRDRAGNVSLVETVQFTLAIAGPTVTINAAQGAAYTKSSTPGVKVVAKVGTTVLTDATFIVKVTTVNTEPTAPTAASNWKTAISTVTLPAQGTNYLWAWAKNSNGSISLVPGTDFIVFDNVKPTATLEFDEVENGSNVDTTSDRSVALDITTNDAASGVTKWALVNGTTVPATSAFKLISSFPLPTSYTLPFGNGTKTVTLFVMDAAGNISLAATDTVIMTLAAPTVSVDVTATNAYKDGSNHWFTKNLGVAVDIDWIDVAGIGKDGATYKLTLTNVQPTSWSLAVTSINLADTADGLQTIYAWVKDKNGSVGMGSTTITLDRTAPTVTLTVNDNNTATPSFVVTPGLDALSGNDKYALVVGTTAPVAGSPAWVTSGGSVSLVLGGQTVTAFARDKAGNVSTVNAGNSKSVTVTP